MYRALLIKGFEIRVLILDPFNSALMKEWGVKEQFEIENYLDELEKGKKKGEKLIDSVKGYLTNMRGLRDRERWTEICAGLALKSWINLAQTLSGDDISHLKIGLYDKPDYIKAYLIGNSVAFVGIYEVPNKIGYLNRMFTVKKNLGKLINFYDDIWKKASVLEPKDYGDIFNKIQENWPDEIRN